jgi:potassium-dependent mechanosensitive channel
MQVRYNSRMNRIATALLFCILSFQSFLGLKSAPAQQHYPVLEEFSELKIGDSYFAVSALGRPFSSPNDGFFNPNPNGLLLLGQSIQAPENGIGLSSTGGLAVEKFKQEEKQPSANQSENAKAKEITTDFKTRLEEFKKKYVEWETEAKNDTALKDENKEAITKQLEQLKAQLELAETELAAIEQLNAEIAAIPEQEKLTQLKLDQASIAQPGTAPEKTLDQLKQSLELAKQTLDLRRKELETKSNEIKSRSSKLQQFPKQIENAKALVAEAQKKVAGISKSPKTLLEKIALAQSGLAVLNTELAAERIRLQSVLLTKNEDLQTLQRDLAQRQLIEQERLLRGRQQDVDNFRVYEVKRLAEEFSDTIKYKNVAIRDYATATAEMINKRAELNRAIVEDSTKLAEIDQKLSTLTEDFASIQTKLSVAGLTKAIGSMLRRKREELPRPHAQKIILNDIEQKLPEIQLDIIELETMRNELADSQTLIDQKLDELSQKYPEIGRSRLEWIIRPEVERRREVVNNTIKDLTEYVKILGELDTKARELNKKTIEFSNFVDKHVLWIRSTDVIAISDLTESGYALKSLFNTDRWLSLVNGIVDRWRSHPLECIGAVAALVTVFLLRRRFKLALRKANTRFQASRSLLFRPTLEATFYTIMLSGLWPMLLIFVGWQLTNQNDRSTLTGALNLSLIWIGFQFLIASILYHVTRSDGMAIHHFAWPKTLVTALRNAVWWVMTVCLPLSFARYFFELYEDGRWSDSLGRLLFLAGMIAWATILWRLLARLGKYLKDNTHARGRNWLMTWRFVLLIAMVLTPLTLVLVAGIGYYFSATQVGVRLQITAWLVLLAVILHSLLSRLLTIARQKITMRQMSFGGLLVSRTDETPPQEKTVDIDAVEKQVGRLVSSLTIVVVVVALWQVWATVLPAVQILDQVTLWDYVEETTQEVTLADNTTTLETKSATIQITLTHLLFMFGILIVTWILSRNLPGLLEISLLDRLPIDRGGRYAIAVVCRYVIAGTGIIIASNMIGIRWTSVQWLIAAMTVGLGFGLQEIFGNFVSGIIILLERPVRVGDLVTVSGTTGYVSRIQLRATTITDFDRRELVVPNKKFITDDVINHTLSDTISRMRIPVGIAYGSNTQLAHDLLIQIAQESPYVVDDPEPYVVFTSFGASCLDFELRVYLDTREFIIEAQHSLHMTIDRVFRENGIEIAFPQRDIHIRSVTVDVPEQLQINKQA